MYIEYMNQWSLLRSKSEEKGRNYGLDWLKWWLASSSKKKSTKVSLRIKREQLELIYDHFHSSFTYISSFPYSSFSFSSFSSLGTLKYPLTFSIPSSSSSLSPPSSPCNSRKQFRYSSASSNILLYRYCNLKLQQMQACEQTTCRGGLSCCSYDSSLGAYCITDTFCNSVPPLWQTIFIPIFLFLATLGILVVIYYKYRKLRPRLFTLADFVERQVRLQPIQRHQHTKMKTITSFE